MTIPTSIFFSISREPKARVKCVEKKIDVGIVFIANQCEGRAKFNCFIQIYIQMSKKCDCLSIWFVFIVRDVIFTQ